MSDSTSRGNDDTTPIEPEPATPAPAAAAPVAATTAPAVNSRWYGRRVPLLVTVAALILGCLLGGGAVAIAALAHDGGHGDRRGNHSSRDERAGGRGNDGGSGWRNGNRGRNGRNGAQSNPAPATSSSSAPAVATPTPSASA